MTVAFVITRAEEEIAARVWDGSEYPRMDGNLFRFRGVDTKPAIADLLKLADETDDRDEANAAMRLAGRLGTWLGRNHVPEPVVDEPENTPSPAPAKRGRKGKEDTPPVPVEPGTDED